MTQIFEHGKANIVKFKINILLMIRIFGTSLWFGLNLLDSDYPIIDWFLNDSLGFLFYALVSAQLLFLFALQIHEELLVILVSWSKLISCIQRRRRCFSICIKSWIVIVRFPFELTYLLVNVHWWMVADSVPMAFPFDLNCLLFDIQHKSVVPLYFFFLCIFRINKYWI